MKVKALEVSAETQARLKAIDLYGSWENQRHKLEIIASEVTVTRAYLQATKEHSANMARYLEGIAKGEGGLSEPEEPSVYPPYWASPFMLRDLPLALIGAPETSPEYEASTDPKGPKWERAALLPGQGLAPRYKDYRSLGWPKSCGRSARFVTPEEDREIRRRLANAGLTKPGAEVMTVGKTLAEMVAENEPAPPWLIEGILRRGGAAMIYGPPGVGKSFLTHTLMLLVAAGKGVGVQGGPQGEWLLRAGDHKDAKVCLVDGEMIGPDLTNRMRDLAVGLGLKPTGGFVGEYAETVREDTIRLLKRELDAEPILSPWGPVEALDQPVQYVLRARWEREVSEAVQRYRDATEIRPMPFIAEGAVEVGFDRIEVYAKTVQDVRAEFPDLADPECLAHIVGFAKGRNLDLIVFENLSTLSPSLEDENSSANWNPLNELIVALKKEGIAVLLIHHANKGNSGYRGSTNLATTLETVVKLERPQSQAGHKGAAMKVMVEKSRANGRPFVDGKVLKLQEMRWIYEEDPHDLAETVVREAKSLRYRTQGEVAKALGYDQATISRALKLAVGKGLCSDSEWKQWFKAAKAYQDEPVEADEDEAAGLDI